MNHTASVPARDEWTPRETSKGPLDRALGIFTDVRPGEGTKQANDTFFVRMGDVLSAGVVFAGTTWLGFAPRHFALVNVALIVVWLILAVVIGRRFHRMAGESRTPNTS